jgi:putative nucleotidyltransferase with HDIG domain
MLLGRFFYRVRQFFAGMFAVYTRSDLAFAQSYLNIQEMALFNQLPGFEKKHAVWVAKRMLNAVHGEPHFDERRIAKIGLLHDIGKVVERNSTLTKSWLVIIRFLFPAYYDHLAERGREDPRFRCYYIHKHHGAVGADLLAKIGAPESITVILKNHDPRAAEERGDFPPELQILRDADTY